MNGLGHGWVIERLGLGGVGTGGNRVREARPIGLVGVFEESSKGRNALEWIDGPMDQITAGIILWQAQQ